jgi:hypothetical protein
MPWQVPGFGLPYQAFSCMLIFMTQDVRRGAGSSLPQGCLVAGAILSLAFGLMLSTKNVTRHNDTFACYGGLGAGFPVSFLCDYSGGGSPISSAGRIDMADFPYFSPQGTLADLLFYSIQLGMIGFMVTGIMQKNYRLAALVLLLYVAGFLSAVLLFQPIDVRIERSFPTTPTPAASPTTIAADSLPATPDLKP